MQGTHCILTVLCLYSDTDSLFKRNVIENRGYCPNKASLNTFWLWLTPQAHCMKRTSHYKRERGLLYFLDNISVIVQDNIYLYFGCLYPVSLTKIQLCTEPMNTIEWMYLTCLNNASSYRFYLSNKFCNEPKCLLN